MTRRSPLPPHLAGAPFTRSTALVEGVSAGRLRAADLGRPFHGVRSATNLGSSVFLRCAAYELVMSPDAAFSHTTAARLRSLELPAYLLSDAMHVTIPSGRRPPEGRGVRGHELDARRWRTDGLLIRGPDTLHEFRVVSAEVMWAQLAPLVDPIDLVAIGDQLLLGKLATPQSLARTVDRWRGQRGAKALAWSLQYIRGRALSRPESLQRVQLVLAGLPEPDVNVVVTDLVGRDVHMADLAWKRFRVLIEYEGDGHRTSSRVFRNDIQRFERYSDAEWSAIRSVAPDVFEVPDQFTARVWRRLVARGWRPGRRELRHVSPARW